MLKKNLSREAILTAAIDAVTETGYEQFSLRDLAIRLGCKAASLYNHINGIDDIKAMLAVYVANKLRDELTMAVEDRISDEAFLSAARTYRKFALENHELYKVFISIPSIRDERVDKAAFDSFHPLWKVVSEYSLSKEDTLHFVRSLRSVMHGFIELTANGFMQKGSVSQDESYEVIIKSYLEVLKSKSRDFTDKIESEEKI